MWSACSLLGPLLFLTQQVWHACTAMWLPLKDRQSGHLGCPQPLGLHAKEKGLSVSTCLAEDRDERPASNAPTFENPPSQVGQGRGRLRPDSSRTTNRCRCYHTDVESCSRPGRCCVPRAPTASSAGRERPLAKEVPKITARPQRLLFQ